MCELRRQGGVQVRAVLLWVALLQTVCPRVVVVVGRLVTVVVVVVGVVCNCSPEE